MGCNCKNKAKGLEKYLDWTGDDALDEGKLSFFGKIMEILFQLLFGILCGAVIIVVMVPAMLYVTVCMMTGRQAHFKIKLPKKRK